VRWLRGFADGLQNHESSALLGHAAHKIEHRINDSPDQVASEGAHQHGVHIIGPRRGHSKRAGEGGDHDQAEEHFGDALARPEHGPGNSRMPLMFTPSDTPVMRLDQLLLD